MTHELTMDGLFSYFDPITVEKIIELPLVKRHLSVHDYFQCKESCSKSGILKCLQREGIRPFNAILSFDALQHAPIDEVLPYLSINKIKQAYLDSYGDYFSFYESKILALTEQPHLNYEIFSPMLDLVSEKKLILHIQAAMALPLQAFTNAILEQDFLLLEIASQLTYQAGEAQKFIAAIQEDDEQYKQAVINVTFSVIKMGLSVFHVDQLLSVGQSLSTLASSAFEKIDNKLSSLVSEIKNLVVNAHLHVLEEAERELLSNTAPEDITLRWSMYRAHIFHRENELIKSVLDTCVNNDYFFRCVIKETMYQHKELTQEMLLIHATEKARLYVTEIVNTLKSQVMKIQHIRDAVRSPEGKKKIEFYFQQLSLIHYTMNHENSTNITQGWLTKKLGHRLSFYFPEVIFQKKWSPVTLQNLFHHGVVYCKQKMTLQEYQARRRNSRVVLGLFRNSPRVKEALFSSLEEQITLLSDQLIHQLQQQNSAAQLDDVFHGDTYDTGKRRYCFRRRQLSIFSFHEPDLEQTVTKSINKSMPPIVLISERSLVEQ